MNGSRRERGFTLIELVVTITVISILTAIGVPMYGSFTQETTVSSATSDLIQSLNDARSRAVTDRTTVRVRQVTGGWVKGWEIVRINNPAIDTDDVILYKVNRVTNGTLTLTETTSKTFVDFDGLGRTSARTFKVGIAGGAADSPKRTIAINVFGRASVTKT